MAITRSCKQCNAEFEIADEDLAFYKKISPTFAGKTFYIPPPTLCPECRHVNLIAWRNERTLYKRKSDKSGKEIVSMFPPDNKIYKVFSTQEWWADDWDALKFGRNFDPKKKFFQQYGELLKDVPKFSLFNMNTENSEFSNYTMDCKNCYMSIVSYYGNEEVHYSYWVYRSKNSVDVFNCESIENCYRITFSNKCYNCRYSTRLKDCRDCKFCFDMTGCSDCLLSYNLRHKQYCIKNKQYSAEQYGEEIKKYDFGSNKTIESLRGEYKKLMGNFIVKNLNINNCENSTGDNLRNCKNVYRSFNLTRGENVRYGLRGVDNKDCSDLSGGSNELCYNSVSIGYSTNINFSFQCEHSNYLTYCINCFYCNNCFACNGLRHKEYCILNKEYSKGEYEKTVAKIIESMTQDKEWGEFLPISLSYHAYNETLANSYFPKTKEGVAKIGAKWQDNDFSLKYDGPFYETDDNISKYLKSEDGRSELLNGILKCEKSGKPYKIMPQELAFYLKSRIPIPREHFNVRYQENFATQNPLKFRHRQCMCTDVSHSHSISNSDTNSGTGTGTARCPNEFKTTYAPDRPEKVYCEECYQKSII